MKKIILITTCILFTGILFGQTLQKGNLVGFHVGTVMLEPDVTFDQWKRFYIDHYLPAFNNEFKDEMQMYIAEGERGDEVNFVSAILVFKSKEVRDKYIPEEGTPSELYISKVQKIQTILDEANKLGKFSRKHFTDWIIQ
jgi:hypothetical protein